jgi:muramoyltetrapeptide carboxypeptidase
MGDRIGVLAPGGPVRAAALERGIGVLERRGFVVVRGAHLQDRSAYLAGEDEHRAADVNRMLADRSVRALWCARGGYGSHRIVADLDLDALRRAPRALIGYSDITVLQAAAWKRIGLVTFQGPMVAELGERGSYDAPALWRALGGGRLRFDLPRRSILRAGRGSGPLVGGCLSILVSLLGTPYQVDTRGAVLFWEEVNEQPFRIDRMLAHLKLAGCLKNLRGMVIGRLVGCRARRKENDMPLEEILRTHLAGTNYPVVVDFPSGHTGRKVTLPLGRAAALDTPGRRLTIAPGAPRAALSAR